MPRGSGKTTLVEAAILWAALYGHRRFAVALGVSAAAAAELLDSIKVELEFNEPLGEDFPEVCLPVRALEGLANRCKGQLCGGESTRIEWGKTHIVLPTVEGSAASGVVVRVAGLLGRIRGMKYSTTGGEIVRPDLVAIDDPQTDATAKSDRQIRDRLRTITSTVLGLAGPGKEVAAFCPCTVIRRDDVAHQLLDRTKNPEWRGVTMKLLPAMPGNVELWEQYGEIRAEDLAADAGPTRANEFYLANRAALEAGAVAAWPERKLPAEYSAVHHAMNLYLSDREKFAAEYQNEPLREAEALGELTADEIAGRLNNTPRGTVPVEAQHLTAFVDVQGSMLFWLVAAWGEGFTGSVIDYGAYPEQSRRVFTLRTARPTLAAIHGEALEAAIYSGLGRVVEQIAGRSWRRADGGELRVERILIDANWGQSTDTVYLFARQSAFGSVVMPSHGRYVGASTRPLSERVRKPGERRGPEWFIPVPTGGRTVRHVTYDTNFWKSFTAARLAVPVGGRGSLTLYGDRADRHELLSAHLTAEYRIRVEARGRSVDEWKLRALRPDNHWLDCLVGAAVAASTLGVVVPESSTARPPKRTVSFKEMQRLARERRNSE
jgi:hypothetical protein